jgi:hypothetical protein
MREEAIQMNILIYGHGAKSPLGNSDRLRRYIKEDIVKYENRYRRALCSDADIIVLSHNGSAFGHFEISYKTTTPNERDREAYRPVKCVHIVGKRALYKNPVKLMPLGMRVNQSGLKISEKEFRKIKERAGHIEEFPKAELMGGWLAPPDIAHNARVADAAITCVIESLGPDYTDRQKDNCGWDLEFPVNGRTLCVEVKGLEGAEIGVELTPNEYKAMKRAMDGAFTEGDYRLAIVCKALSDPILYLFSHEKEKCWRCERSQRQITASERAAARLS